MSDHPIKIATYTNLRGTAGHAPDDGPQVALAVDRFGWACDVCDYVGLGHPSEDAARREHAQVAGHIAAGRLAPGEPMPTDVFDDGRAV